MREIELNVEGMMCTGCENRIKNAVESIDGVEKVTANHETGKVEVTMSNDKIKEVKERIEDIGFSVLD